MNPCILLIEDDEISRSFLSDAIARLDVRLVSCANFTQAFSALSCNPANLIISDLNLPDGTLFEQKANFPADMPVLAMSAELDADTRMRLTALGIQTVLSKPMPIATLHAAIQQLCSSALPLWNEHKALMALGGSHSALRHVRALFVAELPIFAERIQAAFLIGDTETMHATLHKLKASCGFLGAERLLAACKLLDQQPLATHLETFLAGASDTQALIHAADG